MTSSAHPDREVLARLGAQVRARLATQPRAVRLEDERIELYVLEGFCDLQACTHLIGLIDDCASPSCLLEDEPRHPAYRTSYSSDIDQDDAQVRRLESRLCGLTGIAPSRSETAQGQRYHCGQYFEEHCDWFDTRSGYWEHESRCGGQRSWTAMLYLNAVEEGGTTDFTRIAFSVRPRPGALLLWNNALPDGSPNPYTMHAARPVLRGAKYVVTKWFRSHDWQ